MKVLLVSANTLKEPYPVYPLGLDYVAAAIAGGHEVRIADMNVLGGVESLGETIRGFAPDVVGLSIRNIDNTDADDPTGYMGSYRGLVQAIRAHSEGLLVLGGCGFTIYPEAFMDGLEADYGILGEGERMTLLLDAVARRKDPSEIPGVVGRGIGKPFPEPWPDPFHPGFRRDRPHVEFYLKRGGMLNLQTKRGCRYRCIYCTYPHIEGSGQRLLPPESVAQSAATLQAAGARYLFVTDSAFNADPTHSLAVARAFQRAGVSIPWGGYFMPVEPPPGYFRAMAEAGLTHCEFGTDSLSDRVLSSYRKPFQTREVFSAHRAALGAGVHVAHFLLLGGPGETPETVEETLTRAEKLAPSALFFFCGMRIYPNTALFDRALEEGQIARGESLVEPVFYSSPQVGTDEVLRRVKGRAGGRLNWVVGSGGGKLARVVERLHDRGHTGPLWEHLVR